MKIRKNIRKKSITARTVSFIIIVIVISNVMVSVSHYLVNRRYLMSQSRDMAMNLTKAHLEYVEQYFEDIDSIANSLIFNNHVIRFLKEERNDIESLDFIKGIMSIYYSARPDLQLTFYKEGDYVNKYSIGHEQRSVVIEDYRETFWYKKLEKDKQRKVIVSEKEEKDEGLYTFIYRVDDSFDTDVVGYLRIDVELSQIENRMLNSYEMMNGMTIFDKEGNVLFYEKDKIDLPEKAYESDSFGTYQTKEGVVSWSVFDETGWRIAMEISNKNLYQNGMLIVLIMSAVLLVIVIVTVIFSKKSVGIITENYKRLLKGMECVRQGKMDTRIRACEVEDEISSLIDEFNTMMEKVNELMQMVSSKQLLLKEAEIKALQQQINSHFIHNSLETVMGLASEGMNEEIITVSQSLSNIFRYNMRMENTVRLSEVLKHVDNYIQIIQIRFENRFEIIYDIDEECLDCLMVKFTLQPLVENAISHGFRNVYSGGRLEIIIKRVKEKVMITVKDNGSGIQKEKLKELKEKLKETTDDPLEYIQQYKSLGIMNIHLRLLLHFGEQYSMEINSDTGTCITITIPYIEFAGE